METRSYNEYDWNRLEEDIETLPVSDIEPHKLQVVEDTQAAVPAVIVIDASTEQTDDSAEP